MIAEAEYYTGIDIFSADTSSSIYGKRINDVVLKAIDHIKNTASQDIFTQYESLFQIMEECNVDNWDGYEAKPISIDVYNEAVQILKLLPLSLPKPNILPEPNGHIGFEWRRGANKIFVLSVSGENLIVFAGLLGHKLDKRSGSIVFNNKIPYEIIKHIQKIYK